MRDQKEVLERIIGFLKNGIFSEEAHVDEETDLIANGFDSLSLISLLVFIEKTFGLWIPQTEITETNLRSPRSLAAMVVLLLNERQLSP